MEIATPVGRLVQGKLAMQQRKDQTTKQPKFNKDGTPEMGCFFSVAFPKVLPNGMPNAEFDAFFTQLAITAHAAWPQFFPNGPSATSANPKFSWKYQDGDGVDTSGRTVADKPGFKGNHIIKFDTDYPVRCFNEGKFAQHEEIQGPGDIIKRGFWIRVLSCEVKSNNADLSKMQVPGIAIYPKLVSFVERGEEIVSGPDAAAAAAAAPIGWKPPASASPIGSPGGLPASPSIAVPGTNTGAGMVLTPPTAVVLTPPAATPGITLPVFVLSPALAAAGHTLASLIAQGWTEATLVTAGHGTISTPAPALTPPTIKLAPPLSLVPPVATGPGIVLTPAVAATGATIESLIAQGWTADTLVQHGHATRIG